MIDFFSAIYVIGFLIILLEVVLILVWWRKGTEYRRMEHAYRAMARETRRLEDRSRAPFTMWDVDDDLADDPFETNDTKEVGPYMAIEAMTFIRKPLYVDAVRITATNFDEVATWCQGEVLQDEVAGKGTTKKYIKVRVHNPKNARQTKAFIGDWLLYTERGYKVYTNKAFHAAFDEVVEEEEPAVSDVIEETRANAVANGKAVETELAPGIVQTVPQNKVIHPSIADQIRQLQSVGQNTDQIAEVLGITTDSVRHIADPKEIRYSRLPDGTDAEPSVGTTPLDRTAVTVEDVPPQESIVPAAAEGKRVLSIAEQQELAADEVRELVQTGEAVLAQDLPTE